MALPPVSLSPPSWAAASLLFALAFPLAGLALAKALEATFLNEFSGFPFGCFHGRLIAHLGHEQRGEKNELEKETFEVAASEGQARRDGSRKLVGGSRRASGRDQGLREASQGTHLGDERRQPRTNEGLLDEEGEGGVASGAGGGEGTRGLAARTLAGAGREPGRLLRKQQKMARLPQRA